MNFKLIFFALILGAAFLSSCNTPYGTGTERMAPRTDVESLERQSPVTPGPQGGLDAYTASQYGQGRRSYGW